jgi:hypothetical protein
VTAICRASLAVDLDAVARRRSVWLSALEDTAPGLTTVLRARLDAHERSWCFDFCLGRGLALTIRS